MNDNLNELIENATLAFHGEDYDAFRAAAARLAMPLIAERDKLAAENQRLRAEMNWRAEPTYPNWGDTQAKNMTIETPEELREAAERLIQDGQTLGGCGSPYGKHTGHASQWDEIAVGEAYLKIAAENAQLREELAQLKVRSGGTAEFHLE